MFEVLQFLDFDGAEYLLCLHMVSLVSFVGSDFLVRHSIYAHLYGQTSVKYSTVAKNLKKVKIMVGQKSQKGADGIRETAYNSTWEYISLS